MRSEVLKEMRRNCLKSTPLKNNKSIIIKTLLLSLIFKGMFLLPGCSSPDDEKSIQYHLTKLDGKNDKFIRQWLILGPFPKSVEEKYEPEHGEQCTGFYADFLKNDGGELKIRPVEGNIHINDSGDTLTWVYHKTSSDMVNFNEMYSQNDYKVAYAYSEIVSPKDQDVIFAMGSDDGIKVWVNGEINHDHHLARGLHYDQDRIVVNLKKGNNRILVKVDEGTGAWGFALRLESKSDAYEYAKSHLRKMWEYVLNDYVFQPGDSLSIRKGDMRVSLLPGLPKAQLLIEHYRKKFNKAWGIEFGQALDISLDGSPAGLYSVTVKSGLPDSSIIYMGNFYYGDTQSLREYYIKRFEPYLGAENSITNINITAALKRIKVLNEYGKDGFSSRLNYRRIGLISEIEDILTFLEKGEEPFKHRTGAHIRGYYSEIDNAVQLYQVYVPDNYNKNIPMPVVVHLHGIFGRDKPFHKSVPIDRTGVLIDLEKQAKENGYIVVWPHGRGNAVYKGIGRDDFFKVLNEVKQDYNIDDNRIYLTGYSYGGTAALDIASQYPHLFAAVAPIAAFTDYRLLLDSGVVLPESDKKWRDANNTIRYIKNLVHIPVFIQHGDKDNYCDLKNSTKLYDNLKSIGGDVELKIIPGANHFNFIGNPMDSVYKWFKDKKRVENPKKVSFSTSRLKFNKAYWVRIERYVQRLTLASINAEIKGNKIYVETQNISSYTLELNSELVDINKEMTVYSNSNKSYKGLLPENGELTINLDNLRESGESRSEGPINEIYSVPFIIVPGTVGTEEQNSANKNTLDNFLNVWKKRFFTNPRIKNDIDITYNDMGKYNLILIGNPESNFVTNKVIGKLPVSIENNIITVGDKEFAVNGTYGLQMIYPNPLVSHKNIVLYSFSGWKRLMKSKKLYDGYLLDAWYDFHLFDDRTLNPYSSLSIGFFDSNWQINDELKWDRQK